MTSIILHEEIWQLSFIFTCLQYDIMWSIKGLQSVKRKNVVSMPMDLFFVLYQVFKSWFKPVHIFDSQDHKLILILTQNKLLHPLSVSVCQWQNTYILIATSWKVHMIFVKISIYLRPYKKNEAQKKLVFWLPEGNWALSRMCIGYNIPEGNSALSRMCMGFNIYF